MAMRRMFYGILWSLLSILLILIVFGTNVPPEVSGNPNGGAGEKNLPNTSSLRRGQAERDSVDAARRSDISFSFVGWKTNKEDTKLHSRKKAVIGESEHKSGTIPDLTIELGTEDDMKVIAARFGYLLAAVRGNLIVGKIVEGRMLPVDSTLIAGFSRRAREAKSLPGYENLVEEIGRSISADPTEIKLIWLVPNSVENRFVRTQLQAIRSHDLRVEDVELVVSRYLINGIQVTGLMLKNGESISIQN